MTNDTISVILTHGGSSYDISARVVFATWTQRPLTNGIGTFQIVLDNGDSNLNGGISGDDPVLISVNSVAQFYGRIDKQPVRLKGFSNLIYISGRDSGQDLQSKILYSLYGFQKADDILDSMLSLTSSEITFSSPHTAPEIYYSADWLHLSDQFKEVLESVDYIGFVDKNLALQMWPISTGRDSGITLKSLPGDATNNVVGDVEYEPGDTQDVRDYLIVQGAKTNEDAYTEFNFSDWTPVNVGDSLQNYTGSVPQPPAAGAAAIQAWSGDGLKVNCKLTFPKFWLQYLDLSLITSDNLEIAILAHFDGAAAAPFWPTIYLTDDSGNKMSWGGTDASLNAGNDKWGKTSDVKVGVNENSNAKWHTEAGNKLNFTWKITEIEIGLVYNFVPPPPPNPWTKLEYILIDNLCFPNGIIAANDQTGSSPVHSIRPYKISRPDIKSQVELQQYADQLAPKLVVPIASLNLTAVGSAGLISGAWKWLPGYYATIRVQDPLGNYLPANNSKWRFMELVHVFDPKAPNQNHVYTVQLKMVPFDLVVDNQRWIYLNDDDPNVSAIRRVRDRLQYLERTQTTNIEPTP